MVEGTGSIRERLLREYGVKGPARKGFELDGEKSHELEVTIPVERVRTGVELKARQPAIGWLLGYLTNENCPRIILEDGSVLREPHHDSERTDFNDGIGKLLAKKYNGIFFPSHLERRSFKFLDYLEALKRCIPNTGGGIPEELSQEARENGFPDLSQEAQYLDEVQIATIKRTLRDTQETNGIVGKVHRRKEEEEHLDTTFFTDKDKSPRFSYEVRLNLSLEGFGGHHLNVSGRTLTAKFPEYNQWNFGQHSDEVRAIERFVREINPPGMSHPDWEKYDLELGIEEYKKSDPGKVNSISLTMKSPRFALNANKRLDHAVMQTHDMLPILTRAANKIGQALKRAREYRKQQDAQKYDKCAIAMGLKSPEPQYGGMGFGDLHCRE